MDSLFTDAIREHLELKQRNAALARRLPLERYRSESASHPSFFNSDEYAGLEETVEDNRADRAGAGRSESWSGTHGDLWAPSPAFDWGD